MKSAISFIICLLSASVGIAQEGVPDSIQTSRSATMLNEVVIAAPKVIRKADMDVYHPSQSAVDNSKDGLQLLHSLMIPSLNVNDVLGTVSTGGSSVQLRINGREATVEQVQSLLPESIKRVEWIDNPGLRYNGATAVLNFIVRNSDLGGSFMSQALQALNCGFGNYYVDPKINSGRSQWELFARMKLTNHLDAHRDYWEKFTLPDGQAVTRNESPLGGILDNSIGAAQLSYSYIKPDTTIFYASILTNHTFSDKTDYNGILEVSDSSEKLLLDDSNGLKGTRPTFRAYLELHFNHGQTLVADFQASLLIGRTFHDYLERNYTTLNTLTDVHTNIKDRNQAYALTANYMKDWKMSKLTVGAEYHANRNRSEYVNLDNAIFHQLQDRVYFFAEYFHRINKVTLTAGIGVQYTSFKFKESDEGNSSWALRPQFTATYTPNQLHQFRLNFTSWQSAPSLAETNIAPQQVDGFQWRIGNPNLKTSTSYMLTLRYALNIKRLDLMFGARAFTSPNAITPYLFWDNDRLVTSYENSRGLDNISIWLSPQIEVIPDWLSVFGMVEYRAERMRGNGYKLYNRTWSGNAGGTVNHWGFALDMQYSRAQRDLWGEKISWGEDVSMIQLSYNKVKNWRFTAGMIMPFGKYDQGFKMLSKYNINEYHMRLDMRMPFIKVNYNIQWGRQKRGVNKLIDAGANVDQSSAAGR